MKKYSLEDWITEGKRKFGKIDDFEFVCPSCKRVQKASDDDFIKAIPERAERVNVVYTNCLGRYTGGKKGPHKCDWAAYGFFNISNTIVINNDEEISVFDFNEKEQ